MDLHLPSIISRIEKKVIEDALRRKKKKSEAMKMLGISRATFYSKIKKYFPDMLHGDRNLF
ncbi:MAG: helix-turn-helix domain-containing protein [Bacillota bacterium]